TLDVKYSHWRRVKNNMPPRYRLFFRFYSDTSVTQYGKCLIFAWFNDEFTLRKSGSKSDVYNVFKSLLANKTVPDNWEELLIQSKPFGENNKQNYDK
ncbi:MAG: type II toxin-antitoxin system YhaV family toxin, partial [Desulfamplus sp.]|nr:type II toxin-antitoxin system YhaV family toxin [Desulfamplus sp.]